MILLASGDHFGIIFDVFSASISVSTFASIFGPILTPEWLPKSTLGPPISSQKATFRFAAFPDKRSESILEPTLRDFGAFLARFWRPDGRDDSKYQKGWILDVILKRFWMILGQFLINFGLDQARKQANQQPYNPTAQQHNNPTIQWPRNPQTQRIEQ